MASVEGSFQWVMRGRQRRVVIMAMTFEGKTLTGISRATADFGIRITIFNMNRILTKLIASGLIEVFEGRGHGRKYRLLKRGKEYQQRMAESPLITCFSKGEPEIRLLCQQLRVLELGFQE